MCDPKALAKEEARIEALRQLVDQTARRICSGQLTFAEAIRLTVETREQAQRLIPDQMDTYDLIYESRFARLIWQFVR